MAKINSFKAYLPSKEKAQLFAIKPDNKSVSDTLTHKKYSFLHTLHPNDNFSLSLKEEDAFYKDILAKFNAFVEENNFHQYHKNALYLYQQKTPKNKFIGIIGGANLEDYINGTIKKHENTLNEKISSLSNYFLNAKINTEPVLIAYNKNNVVDDIINRVSTTLPDLDFNTTDDFNHKIWIIHQEEMLKNLANAFNQINDLYIADGHHRIEAAKTLYQLNKNTSHNIRHVMSLYISEEQLKIKSFNRIIKNLPENFEFNQLLNSKEFNMVTVNQEELVDYFNTKIITHYHEKWYVLTFKSAISTKEVEKLEVEKLNKLVLSPFNLSEIIYQENFDDIIDLISYANNHKNELIFSVPSININTIKTIADAKEIMPAKSTYIEPKLRSGLTIYPIFE